VPKVARVTLSDSKKLKTATGFRFVTSADPRRRGVSHKAWQNGKRFPFVAAAGLRWRGMRPHKAKLLKPSRGTGYIRRSALAWDETLYAFRDAGTALGYIRRSALAWDETWLS